MKQALFNIHDIILILVLALCITQATLNIATNALMIKQSTRNLLTAFLVVNGLIALDTLIFWGEGTRQVAFGFAPWSVTLLSTAMFAFGPIVFCLVRSVYPSANQSKAFDKTFLFHFVPIVATPIYLYWACYQYPIEIQRSLILDLKIYSIPEAYFSTFIFLKKATPLIYGAASLYIVWQNRKSFLFDSCIKPIQPVLYLALGFTIIRTIELLNHLFSAWLPLAYADSVGILGNYLTLCLVMGFMALNGQGAVKIKLDTAEIEAPNDEQNPKKADLEKHELEEIANTISTHMQVNRPHLNSQLTLERFSKELSVPQRLVSRAINQTFDCNFQEFINRYRVEEAKELLKGNDSNALSMEEIAFKAGFNSKPTFNRLFKNITSSTPSHYRQHCH